MVSANLGNIWHENSRTKQDSVLFAALLECEQHVHVLNSIAEELLPGFASVSPISVNLDCIQSDEEG